MTTKADIDKSLADLERMLGRPDNALTEPPKDKERVPSWLIIVGIAAIVDLGTRLFIPSSRSFILVFEASLFLLAAVSLILPVLRKTELSVFRRKLHQWLAAAFGLGAIRSAMWGFGVQVQYANLTVFLLGLAGIAILYFRRKRNAGIGNEET